MYFLKDHDAFIKYCKATKKAYVAECKFYPLSPSLHKIIDHAEHWLPLFPDTIGTGMTSEEASESANKDIKNFQIDHAFQGNPVRRNLDTFHRLVDRSSPLVLVHLVDKKLERRAREKKSLEVLVLLKAPEAPHMKPR